jgi:hypothetical protein
MQNGFDLLLLTVVTFLGVFIIAIMGAESKLRAGLQIVGCMLAIAALKYVIGFENAAASSRAVAVYAMVVGIGASAARMAANHKNKIIEI